MCSICKVYSSAIIFVWLSGTLNLCDDAFTFAFIGDITLDVR